MPRPLSGVAAARGRRINEGENHNGHGCKDRSSAGDSADRTALRTAFEILKSGHALIMYPEGTRSPDGRLRYTASADSLLTPNFRPVATQESAFSHLRYVARGHVRDNMGVPVEGAAICVGGQVILTNTDGEFFIRRRKAGTLPLEVVLGEFLNPAAFRVISAPPTVVASLDGASSEALIILGRE